MIRQDSDIRHSLAHIEIGEPAVQATVSGQRFSADALSGFFDKLREGHRQALGNHSDALADIVGYEEHDELDEYGMFGQFAGRLAVRESGLAIIEKELHHATPPELQASLRDSLTGAVAVLRAA